MTRHALYIIGEPGVGKSTLVEALTDGLPFEEADSPLPFRRYHAGPVELGKRRELFSGTDALAMNIQPVAERFVESIGPALLLAEGDRLANRRWFAHLRRVGYEVHIVHLDGELVAEARRADRGSKQNASWLRGRQTKVWNLVMSEPNVRTLPAEWPVERLMAALDDPVSMALKQAAEVAA